MALRKIVVDYDPVLHSVCREVSKFDEDLHVFVNDLIETLHSVEDGVGLAAPQVGVLKRVAVVDVGEGPIVLINPEIEQENGEQIDMEGCLSFPDRFVEVKRPNFVRVRSFNENGQPMFFEGTGLIARAFCHEIDHLNGIVFLDRAVEGSKIKFDEEIS